MIYDVLEISRHIIKYSDEKNYRGCGRKPRPTIVARG